MEQKNKFRLEYFMKASPEMLYQYLSTPFGLSEWFCYGASSKGNIFTFIWAGSEETATLIARRDGSLVRFRWEEDAKSQYYFEMKIDKDELTGDVTLSITDFAVEDDMSSLKQMWDNSVLNLRQLLGA